MASQTGLFGSGSNPVGLEQGNNRDQCPCARLWIRDGKRPETDLSGLVRPSGHVRWHLLCNAAR